MPQTLLAVAALFCFGLLAFGKQRHEHDVARHTIAIEAELAAADVARARMARVSQLAFDEEDVVEDVAGRTGIRVEPSDSPLGSDAGEAGPDTFDDVDDWDDHTAVEAVPVGRGELQFRAAVRVRYVEDLAPETPAAGPTLTKEIEVSVVETSPPAGRVPATATLRRVVTPARVDALAPDAP
ncbi:hypothetical protein [Rubrivirga sp.]|uniref:hypothetical protein n=1 Tax=Rubrivirga sp. TaxID=1885344 RepID=UPI003B528BEA